MAYSVSALATLNLHMNRIKRRVKTQLFLALVLFLAACGQRGPLYLPEPDQAPAEINETEAKETGDDETEVDETGDDETEVDETEVDGTEDDGTEDDGTEDDREKTAGT
jgi:predicted small lipoprotein YifL